MEKEKWSRRDRSRFTKSLNDQAYEELKKMYDAGIGQSKHVLKRTEEGTRDLIFTSGTYDNYKKVIKKYLAWLKKTHPEVTKLKQSKRYFRDYLSEMSEQRNPDGSLHYSAWSICKMASALHKLYHISADSPEAFQRPKRKRQDIKRSRGTTTRDAHFSIKTHEEMIRFCQGTGCRRNVLERLRGRDLYTREQLEAVLQSGDENRIRAAREALETFPDQDYFIFHYHDKGGKSRYAPICGQHRDQIISRMRSTAHGELVWMAVPGLDIHSYRADYATSVYRNYARPIDQLRYDRKIPELGGSGKLRSEIYICRGDEVGVRLDAWAVQKVSRALGHNRVDTAVSNYLRNL